MSTINDVAKLAGVSKTTVSKILSGKTNIRPSTLEKVNNAIMELNYVPNCFAQSMRTNKTKVIAILIPEQYNYGYLELLRSIEDVAIKNDYMTFVCSTGTNAEYEYQYIREAFRRKVDGIIFFSYVHIEKNMKYLEKISKDIPVVVMDNILEGEELTTIRTDGCELTRRMVNILIKNGRKRIAYIKAEKKFNATRERFQGYLLGLLDQGIDVCEDCIVTSDFTMEGGYLAAKRLMHLKNPPQAIMATTDIIAIGATNFLKEAGYEIPNQVAVVGFDNIELCTWVSPKLSTISQNQRLVGERSMHLLLERINDNSVAVSNILMQGEMVLRETT